MSPSYPELLCIAFRTEVLPFSLFPRRYFDGSNGFGHSALVEDLAKQLFVEQFSLHGNLGNRASRLKSSARLRSAADATEIARLDCMVHGRSSVATSYCADALLKFRTTSI